MPKICNEMYKTEGVGSPRPFSWCVKKTKFWYRRASPRLHCTILPRKLTYSQPALLSNPPHTGTGAHPSAPGTLLPGGGMCTMLQCIKNAVDFMDVLILINHASMCFGLFTFICLSLQLLHARNMHNKQTNMKFHQICFRWSISFWKLMYHINIMYHICIIVYFPRQKTVFSLLLKYISPDWRLDGHQLPLALQQDFVQVTITMEM